MYEHEPPRDAREKASPELTPDQYLKESARTAYTPDAIRLRGDRLALPHARVTEDAADRQFAALLHAGMGMVTEAGEFMDALKKRFIYGKPLDRVNLIEELGDKAWYIALALRALDCTFEEMFDRNIAKLRKRFPDKFTQEGALVRDLGAERAALEAPMTPNGKHDKFTEAAGYVLGKMVITPRERETFKTAMFYALGELLATTPEFAPEITHRERETQQSGPYKGELLRNVVEGPVARQVNYDL